MAKNKTTRKTGGEKMKLHYGFVSCSECRLRVAATKNGLAWKHGHIRVAKGRKRVAFPNVTSGTEAYHCKGSWVKGFDWVE